MCIQKIIFSLFLLSAFSLSVYSGAAADEALKQNVSLKTQAVPIQKEGLENFYKVSDILYRSQQPASAGFRSLRDMGIKTIVNFRAHHSDEKKMKGLDMKYVQIPINTWSLNDRHVEQFLKVMSDESNHPVLVHCQHGADRTGSMVAIYRMVFENWNKEEALKEMTGETFGYHKIWKNLHKYIEKFDIEKWKKYAEDLNKE
jgi:protein tyrosine/serine phosphatase